ncbi:xanthine dehydrogenase molybdopterin binding subunit [Photobacterium gaetbulicola]|uniref:Putative xanthine dehydrogenase, XdhB subunit n=1 Tax=Photobacterium gaetbulicola Gung47 TaxID=658445 RepID=A0A0C5WJF6_9GAMM|nr:xanthine dehydrogenase molybdopterin binding subunit [Photobacterium gaetbulicola]AJR06337.1 putative xanthine dehydrogenase, XdhB subunit [Photobacterium gaetbulicola Gung47]PSU08724.1 xanthine dehydrogenase molybdopterin binding subunit [Photobacterium gaetbulicola]
MANQNRPANTDVSKAGSDLHSGIGHSLQHESARKHATGEAVFVDDRLDLQDQLHLYARLSPHAHARIAALDVRPCYEFDGVALAVTSKDIPGEIDIGTIFPGDPLLADAVVEYIGQPVLIVAADAPETAYRAAQAAIIEYEELPATLGIKQALEKKQLVCDKRWQRRGDAKAALARARHKIEGEINIGGQEHFYMEPQASQAVPTEDGGMTVYASTQNPSDVQRQVAKVLGTQMCNVVVDTRRIGGGFGGKETQAAGPACMAAVVSHLTGRPAKICLYRQEDMLMTGKRHPFYNRYTVGFDDSGVIEGIELTLASNCGYSPDLSAAIMDRAMFHSDNAYYLGDVTIDGYCCRTNIASNTACRGFGAPQAMVTIETVMDQIASYLGKDPLEVRKRNFYQDDNGHNTTHYYQPVRHNLLHAVTEQLETSSNYHARRQAIAEFNRNSPILKRGLAITPIKFGISFTASFLNQAGALIHLYTDGSIHLNHGGTEMGQGLNTKIAQVVAEEFQVDIAQIQISATRTDKVPNTSATAASSGADLNGKAAQNAARTLKQRLITFASEHFHTHEQKIAFRNGAVHIGENVLPFKEFIELAYLNQIALSSTGFYRTPEVHYDESQARGRPFFYYVFGAACSEVIVDTLTGEYKVLRVDICHDVGSSLNPAIDRGQIEGGFIQGMGWLTTEELIWDDKGKLITDGPSNYKIPTIADIPSDFRVSLLENNHNPEQTIFHSKAVGEPPFMLAISVVGALKHAISSTSESGTLPELDTPVTSERVLRAISQLQASNQNSTTANNASPTKSSQ